MMRFAITLTVPGLALGLLLLSPANFPAAHATEGAWPSGIEIARRINARDEGEAVSRDLTMELIDRHGRKRVRETRGFRKYYGDEKRTVIHYLSPTNVRGTAFLTYDYPEADRDDDQWLYLPAMRKTRRISASDRGNYFLGTDFTYEDIKKETKVGIEDYTWKTIGEETVDGHPCFVVEAIPVDNKTAEELGYGRVLQWIDANIWIARRGEFWDVRGNPLKSMYISDIRQVQDIWTPHLMEAHNHKTGHKTRFMFSKVEYNRGVPDEVFTQQALRRGL